MHPPYHLTATSMQNGAEKKLLVYKHERASMNGELPMRLSEYSCEFSLFMNEVRPQRPGNWGGVITVSSTTISSLLQKHVVEILIFQLIIPLGH